MKVSRVVLENFQSHTLTELDLADTLTVITGESDQGKSALVRALQWLMLNEPRGADFIRAGSDLCRVSAIFSDGTAILRERSRSGSKNRYIINYPDGGELVLDGVGISVPPEVVEITGVAPLELDGKDTLNLNFGGQLDAPFLLSENGHIRARAVGRLTGTHLFDLARQRSALELRRAEQQTKRLREEAEQVSEELAGYADVPLMEAALKELNALMDKLSALEAKRESLAQLADSWQQVRSTLLASQELAARLTDLDAALLPLTGATEKAAIITQLTRQAVSHRLVLTQLASTEGVIAESNSLDSAASSLTQLEQIPLDQLTKLKGELSQVTASLAKAESYIPRFSLLEQSGTLVSQSAKKTEAWQTLSDLALRAAAAEQELAQVKSALVSEEEILRADSLLSDFRPGHLQRLQELADQWRSNLREGAAADDERLDAERRLALQAGEYTRVLTAASRCPLCRAAIDQDTAKRIVNEQIKGGTENDRDPRTTDKPA